MVNISIVFLSISGVTIQILSIFDPVSFRLLAVVKIPGRYESPIIKRKTYAFFNFLGIGNRISRSAILLLRNNPKLNNEDIK